MTAIIAGLVTFVVVLIGLSVMLPPPPPTRSDATRRMIAVILLALCASAVSVRLVKKSEGFSYRPIFSDQNFQMDRGR